MRTDHESVIQRRFQELGSRGSQVEPRVEEERGEGRGDAEETQKEEWPRSPRLRSLKELSVSKPWARQVEEDSSGEMSLDHAPGSSV